MVDTRTYAYFVGFDPLGRRIWLYKLYIESMKLTEATTFEGKLIYTNDPHVDDGFKRLTREKKLHWLLIKAVRGARVAAEAAAEECVVKFIPNISECVLATFGLDPSEPYYYYGLVDVRVDGHEHNIRSIFGVHEGVVEVTLDRFLRKEAQFKDAFFTLLDRFTRDKIEVYYIVSTFLEKSSQMLASILSSAITSPDVIKLVLSRWDVNLKELRKWVYYQLLAEEKLRKKEEEEKKKEKGGRGGVTITGLEKLLGGGT